MKNKVPNHNIEVRHASEGWHPAFLSLTHCPKLDPSFHWGDDLVVLHK